MGTNGCLAGDVRTGEAGSAGILVHPIETKQSSDYMVALCWPCRTPLSEATAGGQPHAALTSRLDSPYNAFDAVEPRSYGTQQLGHQARMGSLGLRWHAKPSKLFFLFGADRDWLHTAQHRNTRGLPSRPSPCGGNCADCAQLCLVRAPHR